MLKKQILVCLFLLIFCKESYAIFSIQPLNESDLKHLLETNVLSSKPVLSPSRLRIVEIDYINFEGEKKQGKIMVMDAAAPYVKKIFKTLYRKKFPIHEMSMMDKFKGNDALALEANNSSAFNDRIITKIKSIHAYGLALDINPLQNPFVEIDFKTGQAKYSPKDGIKYANRKLHRPGKIDRPGMAEEVVKLFRNNGFTIWGGDWDSPIDYQHFQTSRDLAVLLAQMDPKDAIVFFKWHVKYYHKQKAELFNMLEMDRETAVEAYQQDHKKFMKLSKDRFEQHKIKK